MFHSKSKIDRAGRALARDEYRTDDEFLEADEVFDVYRMKHLQPLTTTTSEIMGLLSASETEFYVAQRLKRKPQILRKLKRLSVRLSQLQDIGGLRVIVPTDSDVDSIWSFLREKIANLEEFSIEKETDYREKGRDRTGYRALHILIERDNCSLELQIRSRLQHAWSENIERTSVIYGHHLKEEEGDPDVLRYFQLLSDAFFSVENGARMSPAESVAIEEQREIAEEIIGKSGKAPAYSAKQSADVIKSIVSKKYSPDAIHNWILVFDWNTASFVHWKHASSVPTEAMASYVESERQFRAEDGFEVVLVGASEPATLHQTHSHYFGLAEYKSVLFRLDESIDGLDRELGLGLNQRQVLLALFRKNKWGGSRVSRDTIKNHFCAHVGGVEEALNDLIERGLVVEKNGVSLNHSKKSEIDAAMR